MFFIVCIVDSFVILCVYNIFIGQKLYAIGNQMQKQTSRRVRNGQTKEWFRDLKFPFRDLNQSAEWKFQVAESKFSEWTWDLHSEISIPRPEISFRDLNQSAEWKFQVAES